MTLIRNHRGQAWLECVLALSFVIPFFAATAWLYATQWRRTQCLVRTFREARATLGQEGRQKLQNGSSLLLDEPPFTQALRVRRQCANESLPSASETVTLKRLEFF